MKFTDEELVLINTCLDAFILLGSKGSKNLKGGKKKMFEDICSLNFRICDYLAEISKY